MIPVNYIFQLFRVYKISLTSYVTMFPLIVLMQYFYLWIQFREYCISYDDKLLQSQRNIKLIRVR